MHSSAKSHRNDDARGFSLTDLMVVLAASSLLATIGLTAAANSREKAKLERCTANLQQVTRALQTFCDDNSQTLPGPGMTGPNNLWWWYKENVKGYLGLAGPPSASDVQFACPSDRGYTDPQPFHLSSRFDYNSYVFNGVTMPGLPNIAGWKLLSVKNPRKTLMVMEWTAHAPLSWHQSKTGKKNMPFYCDAQSVVGFVDGHVNFSRIYYDGYNAAYTRDPISGYDYQYSGN
jgi:type II secretory pathway pseudopilin PulG